MSMFPAMDTAVSGLQQFQQDINVIGNNIANVNTTAYKDQRIDFQDTLSQALGTDPSVLVGTGVTTTPVESNFAVGAVASTGVNTDMAITGNGFFVVRDPSTGTQYLTRAGDFQLDASGYLVTSQGFRVQGFSDSGLSTMGDIKIDTTGAPAADAGATVSSFGVDATGRINVTLSDGTTFTRGQVLLQNCEDPNALVNSGDNLYSATTAAGMLSQSVAPQTTGVGAIQSDALETSNVDLTDEMSNLITAQRAFEANSKIITTGDEILQDVVNLKRS
ncbi:MAG: flagellar hook-basal body protein [Limisphaerales bacterium]